MRLACIEKRCETSFLCCKLFLQYGFSMSSENMQMIALLKAKFSVKECLVKINAQRILPLCINHILAFDCISIQPSCFNILLVAMMSTPRPRTFSITVSPQPIGLDTTTLFISVITSKIRLFGISEDTRTGKTGACGKAVLTVEQIVLVGQVSSSIANFSPFGHLLPVTVIFLPSLSTFIAQPLGQTIQTKSFILVKPP